MQNNISNKQTNNIEESELAKQIKQNLQQIHLDVQNLKNIKQLQQFSNSSINSKKSSFSDLTQKSQKLINQQTNSIKIQNNSFQSSIYQSQNQIQDQYIQFNNEKSQSPIINQQKNQLSNLQSHLQFSKYPLLLRYQQSEQNQQKSKKQRVYQKTKNKKTNFKNKQKKSFYNLQNLVKIGISKNEQFKSIQEQRKQNIDNSTNYKDSQIINENFSQLYIEPFHIQKSHFSVQFIIGKGGFGKVWKVEQRKTRKVYAMKEMSKSLIISKKSVNSVLNERELLCKLKHPFIVNVHYSFQDRDNLYLIMDFMEGGDLRYHIGRQRKFTEEQTKFFITNIFFGLEYLHKNNIIHRDIKPENLVLDSQGYVKITDFGVARVWHPDNQKDTSGTPGYMAPEVMCRHPHTFAVDYFALGIIAFEFMLGRRPYVGRTRQEIKDHILAKKVRIKEYEVPQGWSIDAADFINKLIERKPALRLGINGPDEVKNHPWLKNYPWKKVYLKQLISPFQPVKNQKIIIIYLVFYIQKFQDNFDIKQIISYEDELQEQQLIQQNAILLKKQEVQSYIFQHLFLLVLLYLFFINKIFFLFFIDLFKGYNLDNTVQNNQENLQSDLSYQNKQINENYKLNFLETYKQKIAKFA
ncbi:protein kinase domain protein [Ichthyophthirius multifiliis]|uniref:non-specific serine/threonine protein kinase n=1 Tax=Ichthyophthirius multifiliis TaxID=5932 RepID=G0R3R0_ICHMU|nr:protein kinase domain protein [Ichthyophthirius multifiliis]EGR27877.1 protein kinase domain protein [Ichthyophthirius multifiliis]|eukprot:XP_004027222.1 protein kinase domain protein [Ichthyophthirius multifiliis]